MGFAEIFAILIGTIGTYVSSRTFRDFVDIVKTIFTEGITIVSIEAFLAAREVTNKLKRFARFLYFLAGLSMIFISAGVIFRYFWLKAIGFFVVGLELLTLLILAEIIKSLSKEKIKFGMPISFLLYYISLFGIFSIIAPDFSGNAVSFFIIVLVLFIVGSFAFYMEFKTKFFHWVPLLLVFFLLSSFVFRQVQPQAYNATVRYVNSVIMAFGSARDKKSLDNETFAATTWGVAIEDITMGYSIQMTDNNVTVTSLNDNWKAKTPHNSGYFPKGTIVQIKNPADISVTWEGQNFVEVKLPNLQTGRYVGGETIWIESYLLELTKVYPKKFHLLGVPTPEQLQAELEACILEKVKTKEAEWGPAKYVEVNWSNWKKETELPHTGKIYFFSTGHVMMKDSDWNMAIKGRIRTNEIGYIEFTSRRKMDIYFKMADRPAKIWYWPNPALS